MRQTARVQKEKRRITKRGGAIENVVRVLEETPITGLHIINESSKFVVVTYWWGRANQNANLQYPCVEDIKEIARDQVIQLLGSRRPLRPYVKQTFEQLNETARMRPLTRAEVAMRAALQLEWADWKTALMSTDAAKRLLKQTYDAVNAREQAKPGSRPQRGYLQMIEEEWEVKCQAANVNYIALNAEFAKADYQNAINGKPLFIKKVLDAVKPRAVLYIDGDEWLHKYPHICDIDNVDFMARGWNMDPRSSKGSVNTPYYDPYTFETSGGTMYFGNTQAARDLLDKWAVESAKPVAAGKADDRILSQVFTTQSLVLGTNIINLPIEYLWLTDLYKVYLTDANSPGSIEDAIIEHPYCLTGEERATDQGAAANREPVGYEEEVTDNINYKTRDPEALYEYIFFDGNQQMRDEFGRYLKYMKDAKNGWTRKPLVNLVDFADRYGEFNPIATRNLEGLTATPAAQPTKVSLPLTAPIPEILKALFAGNNVELGGPVEVNPEDEFVATDASTREDGLDMYIRYIKIDTTKPMFISGKSNTARHLLAMCETLADINKHVRTYMFMSRIRWNLLKADEATAAPAEEEEEEVVQVSPIVPPTTEGIDFKRVVHQIWFGGDMPDWRKKMFDYNRAVCKKHGFKYSLWKNEDRNEENFPQTLGYQAAAIAKGTETGQSRWAQVADLARLEIVYNVGGIYADSLVEISPALLKGVVEAINSGAKFVGCNEDQCNPPLDCQNSRGEKYLSNSFFAATRANPIFQRLLSETSLDNIDMENAELNHTTGPYFLRSGITLADEVFLFDSAQIYQFNQQETPYKPPTPNRFLFREQVPGSIKVSDTMYFLPGGIEILQQEFVVSKAGPLATYHSGLGGTWST